MDKQRPVTVERVDLRGGRRTEDDVVAHEEPLGIRIQGVDIAVVMRTPGNDLDLVRGFLLTEGIVRDPADIVRVAHCEQVTAESEDNIVDVTLGPAATFDLADLRRNLYASSSCGVCGKATIENATKRSAPLNGGPRRTPEGVAAWPARLYAAQAVFHNTGGLHGVMLLDAAGTREVVREDVGRHNAVDKVVGAAVVEKYWPLLDFALVVSGRVSFEVVQKAAFAGVPIVAAVGAPTSLAVRTADELGVTLCGCVRDGRFNIYSHGERIAGV